MIKLIAIDVDDTLLDPTSKLSAGNAQALRWAVQQGVKIVLCTGRPLVGVQDFLDAIGIQGDDQYVVTYNGAVVQSVTGQIVVSNTLTRTDYLDLAAFADEHRTHYNALDLGGRIFTGNTDVGAVTVLQAWENHAGLSVVNPQEVAEDTVIPKFLFVGQAAHLDQIVTPFKERFGDRFATVRSTPIFFEALQPGVDKGTALAALCAHLGFQPSEVMGIGDEFNDLPMFDFVGTAVAMGNGRAQVRAAADWVTADNAHDGVAVAVNKYLGGATNDGN
ncbi:Cof-type HAD-IIB family hydrolase [Lacticaseibacillus thailandensis]|uniref:HAD superfamily hydrolase n=2 Tax=Lacticaseibacillus thailandensis TaxID=381741 RepID=A0A0R2CEL3_9LACO|nr:Cof-type HAD-IIB family hydrolase [Lacticaseibacillus thailandensis]KRM86811.1 HAD superfamily hydrolase [Lacticaseibacillus thailandensis DSM 22698 = JCM 13996]